MRCRLAAGLLLSLVACGSDSGGALDAATVDASSLNGEVYALDWGPVPVAPGVEGTKCVNLRLSNTTPIQVNQLRNTLGIGSHHLIVYKDDMETVERTTPYDCQPFSGALNLSGMVAPIMITQKAEDTLRLPAAVAYTLAPTQMIRIEMHYINSTDAPIEVGAKSEFFAARPEDIQHEANILFIGTPDIDIAPGETKDVQAYFNATRARLDVAGMKFFAITGHTHKMGTNVTVATAATSGGARTSVYAPAPFRWDEPETTVHAPEFALPVGGGFDIKCSYTNTSTQRLGFGESANDEMCFFWAYYYPSRGAHVCVHATYNGTEVDICCPDAGAVCQQLENQL